MRLESSRIGWFTQCAAAVILCAALAKSAGAQRDTSRVSSSFDSTAAALSPRSISDAEVAGLKLIGVYDAGDGHWIDAATIRDTLGAQALTSKIGVAVLNQLTPIAGYYLIEIRKAGYVPRRLMVRTDSSTEVMVALEPNPLGNGAQLAPVIITDKRRLAEDDGSRRGFIDRCQIALVSCVGRKDLDLHSAGGLDALLNHVDGIHRECLVSKGGPVFNPAPSAAPNASLIGCLIQMRPAGGIGYCTPAYFINGFEWQPLAGAPQADLDRFLNSSVIDVIEVYLATAPHPARFDPGPSNDCGAVVIWTR